MVDHIPGGLGDLKVPSDFDPKQLAKGVKVEMEHTSDPDIAREIAIDHLTEDPKYYDKLEKIEKHAAATSEEVKKLLLAMGMRAPQIKGALGKVMSYLEENGDDILRPVLAGRSK
ncbi:MAG TPA: DUF5661 family protein, partial [Candidatus Obscuribacterales bacterium]